jgi:hypothetical protein
MGGLEIDRIDDFLCGACSLVGIEDGYVGVGVGTDLRDCGCDCVFVGVEEARVILG